MVSRLLHRASAWISTVLERVAGAALVVVAFLVRLRAGLLDLAGAICLALFVERYLAGGALLVAAVWLMLTAYNLERTPRRRRDGAP